LIHTVVNQSITLIHNVDVVVERHRRGVHRLLELRHYVGGLPHPQEVEPLEGPRRGRVKRPRRIKETQRTGIHWRLEASRQFHQRKTCAFFIRTLFRQLFLVTCT